MKDTWNFPTWWCTDLGPNPSPGSRNAGGSSWECGPGYAGGGGAPYNTQPFTNTITAIISFMDKTNWSPQTYVREDLYSLGVIGDAQNMFWLYTQSQRLHVYAYDRAGTALRYHLDFGDEDGTSNLKPNKWYQFGVSLDATSISYCMNGSTTPATNITTNSPGALDFTDGNENFRCTCSALLSGVVPTYGNLPGYILGPAAFSKSKLDFSDATVRARIWDSDGNFKHPGQNGCLWFTDTYVDDGSQEPRWYFSCGVPWPDTGGEGQGWYVRSAGASGSRTCPGGVRKQWEALP